VPGVVAGASTARASWKHQILPAGCFLVLGAGVGAASGVLWQAVVDLPTYRVGSNGSATTSERGLAGVLGGDAWFCLIGAVVGLGLGLLAWRRFGRVGWPVVPLAMLTATVAGLLCWLVGTRLAPESFEERLATAQPGDLVPISLALRAKASLLVWPFLTVVPILLGSSLGAEVDVESGGRAPGPASVGEGR